MSENIDLTYGNHKLKLTKSDHLIGVKPAAGMAAGLDHAVRSVTGDTPVQQVGAIGGFQILNLNASEREVDRKLDELRAQSSISVGTHVYHMGKDEAPFVPTGEIYIEFAEGTSQDGKQRLLDDFGLEIVEARDENTLVTRVTALSENPVKTAAKLQQAKGVSVAEPDLATPGQLANIILLDALVQEQWHLRNTGRHRGHSLGFKKGADARIIDAWEWLGHVGKPDVVVAVIDDGFDLNHPDLTGPGKLVHPWDFTRNSNDPSPDPRTRDWHGTACAGVAVGRVGGGMIVGAAPAATLMPIRWGRNLADREIENWFGYVERMGAWVVSCSWGAAAKYFPLSTRASRAITKCATMGRAGKGCVIVFAAGNERHDINDPDSGTLDGFAIHPDIIAVAASTSRDERANYSNYGKEIWVCAPSNGAGGWGVLTSDVTGVIQVDGVNYPLGYAGGDYTYDFGGTSSACPLVAGVCALLLSVDPDLTAQQVKDVLKQTARRIGDGYDEHGHSVHFGFGCVDALAAVQAVAGKSVAGPRRVARGNSRKSKVHEPVQA